RISSANSNLSTTLNRMALSAALRLDSRLQTRAVSSYGISPCASTTRLRQRASENTQEQFELGRNHWRRHYGLNRCVLSQTQGDPGHCLRGEWPRRWSDSITPAGWLSRGVWSKYDPRD